MEAFSHYQIIACNRTLKQQVGQLSTYIIAELMILLIHWKVIKVKEGGVYFHMDSQFLSGTVNLLIIQLNQCVNRYNLNMYTENKEHLS